MGRKNSLKTKLGILFIPVVLITIIIVVIINPTPKTSGSYKIVAVGDYINILAFKANGEKEYLESIPLKKSKKDIIVSSFDHLSKEPGKSNFLTVLQVKNSRKQEFRFLYFKISNKNEVIYGDDFICELPFWSQEFPVDYNFKEQAIALKQSNHGEILSSGRKK